MKKLLTVMAVVSLTACGSPSPYNYGYLESRITDNRYRVSYRGTDGVTENQVKDMALLRAAELTLVNNYDWFRVVSQQTEEQQLGGPSVTAANGIPSTYRSCNSAGCTTTVVPADSPVLVGDDANNRYETSIEIVMGDGRVEDTTTVYDASEIRRSLSSRY
jgi:hypothetical protein